MKKYIFNLTLLFLISFSVFAQKFTLSGYIRDASSGEDLIGANIYLKEAKKGTITNTYGFYSLTFVEGDYTLKASFIGYKPFEKKISLRKNQTLNIQLQPTSIVTEEVTISGERSDKNVQDVQSGKVSISVEKIKAIPAFMGEVDILKTIQLLPGVQSGGEGNSGFYVRGGGPDQNLILLDEATVYNASHLFGFFSVFNADAVKNVELIKGGMPAQYGGRLSSVLNISMKEGNNKGYHVDGGIGLISSRLTVQGPIKKDTCAFIVSARRTYIDIIAEPFIPDDSEFKGSGYFFYDLNTKLNFRFSDKDRLFVSGYFGRDVFKFNNKESGFNIKIPWGNATASFRWNHLFNKRLFVNTSLIFSDYEFEFDAQEDDFELKLFSGIRDYNAKVDFTFIPNIRHNLKFGLNYCFHTFTPTSVSARIGETKIDQDGISKQYAHDVALYINEEYDLTDFLRISGGLRATRFTQVGPFDRFILDQDNQPKDTISYPSGEEIVSYQNIEPRFSFRWKLNSTSSIKGSYTQNYQYIHLASISSVSLPTDLWVPSSTKIKPQFGVQYSFGYFKNFKEDLFETSAEVYYKDFENQIEYANGATPGDNIGNNADNNFTIGKGKSYGLELFFKKRFGKTTGWIGYTLSKTTRQFPELNDGEEFSAKYDRTHDLSITATHQFNKRWSISGVFIYATGNSLTLPIARYLINGNVISEYGKRNSYRMAPYHRMDVSVTYTKKKTGRFESSWNFSIFNIYNNLNPYFIYFETEGNIQEGTFKTNAKQVSLFPILPSIAWNFKF